MMSSTGLMKRSMLSSALAGKSMIRPNGARVRRTIVTSLMLTSLVDAFSILVIFLIMNHSTSQVTVDLGKKIVLPSARESQFIQDGLVVRVEGDRFFVNEKNIGLSELVKTLKDTHMASSDEQKSSGLVIVADQSMDYADLSPVILAGSQAGYTKFKFAVIRQE